MTTPVFKLSKGVRYIDLQSGRYRVHQGWAPPPVAVVPLLAEGTSANRNGATLVDRRAITRSFELRINVLGATDAEVRRGIADLQTFLGLCGDEAEPLYLEFRPNSDTPEPLWGNYGANLRYEIVYGIVKVENTYLTGARLATDVDVVLQLTIKPYAVGKAQRLSSGTGAIVEDVTAAADGLSRGVIVAQASATGGNEFTNPVFGNSTWNSGWTADASLTASQNTDPRFVLFGQSSAKLVSASTGQEFYQSINTGDTNTHAFSCYVKLPDGSAPSSSDMQLYYNATLTTTFTAVGDGWYRATATATGINAATNTGVQVKSGRTVYVTGFQMEELGYSTAFFYGDMLGCAWSGTAHASSSTRTAGRLRLAVADDTFSMGQGTVRVVLRFTSAATYPDVQRVFHANNGATGFLAQFNTTRTQLQFLDGTNTASASISAPAVGEVHVYHFVYGPSGLVIYDNGASVATQATYTPPTGATYLYIGCSTGTTFHGPWVTQDFATFDTQLTAAQVLADYTNITQVSADGQRVSTVPWLWTKDGDDVVDNADDSSRDNWCVVGGVPGSEAADTLLVLGNSAGWLDTGAYNDLVLSLVDTPYEMFLRPASWIYFDLSGTVDANSSGGEYLSTSVTTSEATEIASQDFVTDFFRRMSGREVFVYMRIYDEGTGLPSMYVRLYPSSSLNDYYATTGLQQVSTTQNNWRLLKFGSFVIHDFRDRGLSTTSFSVPHWEMRALRASGTNNLRFDYVAFVPRPALVFSSDGGNPQAIIRGGTGNEAANWSATANGDVRLPARMFGDAIELRPNLANMLVSFIGSSTANPAIATTLTYHRVIVTPRYALL